MNYQGRLFLKADLPNGLALADVKELPSMKIKQQSVTCNRCNSQHQPSSVELSAGIFYCPSCIGFGRVRSDQPLLWCKAAPPTPLTEITFAWQGSLSVAQETISNQLNQLTQAGHSSLLHAVTGAGKTEILFKSIYHALIAGKRIALTTPRIDVCNELFPRIQEVFPEVAVQLWHGGMPEYSEYSPLIICTTHQLLKFRWAFDLIIVDELDAFPFEGNPLLNYGLEQAKSKNGQIIYVTATPTKNFLKTLNQAVRHLSLPARFHGRPLPVPKLLWWNNWQKKCGTSNYQHFLLHLLQHLLQKHNVLLFCPSIELMNQLDTNLRRVLSDITIAQAHANDQQRLAKVETMRKNGYRLFLTTTILERGVTFEGISVVVLGANHPVFTKASLVQIAGRVDRKGDCSNGEVYFIYDEMTIAIQEACREIQAMNQAAKRGGLLHEVSTVSKSRSH